MKCTHIKMTNLHKQLESNNNVLAIYIYVHSELKGNLLSKKWRLVLSLVSVTSIKFQLNKNKGTINDEFKLTHPSPMHT